MKNIEIDLIEKECKFYQQRMDELCKAKRWHEINNSDGTLAKYFTHYEILKDHEESYWLRPKNTFKKGTYEWNNFQFFSEANTYKVKGDPQRRSVVPRNEVEFKYVDYYSCCLGLSEKQMAFLRS